MFINIDRVRYCAIQPYIKQSSKMNLLCNNNTNSIKNVWNDSHLKRTVILVDMDCFYVQVEQRLNPSLKGKPCAVVQYNDWKGGGIIAVDYIARDHGVTRQMRGDDAQQKCPDIILVRVPTANEKADLTRYRNAGAEVINVLSQFGGRVERASIDEAYIDITDVVNKHLMNEKWKEYAHPSRLKNTYVEGWTDQKQENNSECRKIGIENWCRSVNDLAQCDALKKLTVAAAITEDIRAAVYQQTGFRCSAGISHNKMLAKLACGLHKPNKQSILPFTSVNKLFDDIKVGKIRNLGGKLGATLSESFQVQNIGQVRNIPISLLNEVFGSKTSVWLREVCHGIDWEEVKDRHIPLSIGCGKNFTGPSCLNSREKVVTWCEKLMLELSERLKKDKTANERIAKTLMANVKLDHGKSLSRSCTIYSYEHDRLSKDLLSLLQQLNKYDSSNTKWSPGILSINVSAKKFESTGKTTEIKFKSNKKSFDSYTEKQKESVIKPEVLEQDEKSLKQSKKSENSFPKSLCLIDKEFKKHFSQDIKKLNLSIDFNKKSMSQKRDISKVISSVNGQEICQQKKLKSSSANKYSITQISSVSKKSLKNISLSKDNEKFDSSFINSNKKSYIKDYFKSTSPISKENLMETCQDNVNLKENEKKCNTITVPVNSGTKSKEFKLKTEGQLNVKTRINCNKSLPLGFFHQKSKFASAIRSAISSEEESFPVTSTTIFSKESEHLENLENIQSKANSASKPSNSLWCDFSEDEMYCEKCNCHIAIWEAPDHREFHNIIEMK